MQRNKYGDVKDKRFKFYNGRKYLYSEVERGKFVGYTVVLKSPHQDTYINLKNLNEAWDTINNHCEKYDKIVAMDKLRSDYLSSDEGKWGRQDSFA